MLKEAKVMIPRSFTAFAVALPLCLWSLPVLADPLSANQGMSLTGAAEASKPAPVNDASITFAFKEVGGGLGYEWGKGTLRYNGQTYAFEIGGGGIASLGYIAVTGTGTVKNLEKLEKFDGTYWTVKADAAIGSGVGAAVLENQYGVQLNLKMSIKGAHVGASVMRLRFRLLPDKADKADKTDKADSSATH